MYSLSSCGDGNWYADNAVVFPKPVVAAVTSNIVSTFVIPPPATKVSCCGCGKSDAGLVPYDGKAYCAACLPVGAVSPIKRTLVVQPPKQKAKRALIAKAGDSGCIAGCVGAESQTFPTVDEAKAACDQIAEGMRQYARKRPTTAVNRLMDVTQAKVPLEPTTTCKVEEEDAGCEGVSSEPELPTSEQSLRECKYCGEEQPVLPYHHLDDQSQITLLCKDCVKASRKTDRKRLISLMSASHIYGHSWKSLGDEPKEIECGGKKLVLPTKSDCVEFVKSKFLNNPQYDQETVRPQIAKLEEKCAVKKQSFGRAKSDDGIVLQY